MADVVECTDTLGGDPAGAGSTCEGDSDGDGIDGTCGDECPGDAHKTSPGLCGCGVTDADSDGDTIPDCNDQCDGEDDLLDGDGDGVPDCLEQTPIPTLSEWGLAILTLLLLSMARVCFGRHARVAAATR
jgi:hypothetical protein